MQVGKTCPAVCETWSLVVAGAASAAVAPERTNAAARNVVTAAARARWADRTGVCPDAEPAETVCEMLIMLSFRCRRLRRHQLIQDKRCSTTSARHPPHSCIP
jgi:hypothetical protein